jgi:CheY-like chemotaxis protein
MLNVLLVEDNADNASVIEDVFTYDRVPAKLIVAGTGEEGIRKAVSDFPVLILLDLCLPTIDGLETIELLKCNPLTKNIPVWAVTACAMPGDEERAEAVGCSRYFTKPLPLRRFSECLRTFLQEQEQESREHVQAQGVDR